MSGSVGNINRLVPGLVEQLKPTGAEQNKQGDEAKASFTELFSNMINSVDGVQKDAAQLQDAFMNGEPVELHEMMIKAQEAGVAMDLLLEVRNKFINAYNEIMRMPI